MRASDRHVTQHHRGSPRGEWKQRTHWHSHEHNHNLVVLSPTFRTACGALIRISLNATNPGQVGLGDHCKRPVSNCGRLLQVPAIFDGAPENRCHRAPGTKGRLTDIYLPMVTANDDAARDTAGWPYL